MTAAAWAVAVGLLVCGGLVVFAWALASHGSATFDDALRAGGLAFVASHHAPISVPGGMLTLIPLGFTLLPLACAHRAGRWAARATAITTAPDAWALIGTGSATYAFIVAIIAQFSTVGSAQVLGVHALVAAALVALVGLGTGVFRETGLWQTTRDALPVGVRHAITAATASVAALLTVAGALLLLSAGIHHAGVTALAQSVAPGVGEGLLFLLISVALVPTVAVWSLAYFVGPGLVIGGAAISPFTVGGGLLPAIPILAAIPDDPAPYAPLLLLLAVACGGVGTAVVRRRADSADEPVVVSDLLLGAAFTGSAVTVLVLLTSGSWGTGRLAQVGPNAWVVGLATTGLVLAGALLGALAIPVITGWLTPLAARVRERREPHIDLRGQEPTAPAQRPGRRVVLAAHWAKVRAALMAPHDQ